MVKPLAGLIFLLVCLQSMAQAHTEMQDAMAKLKFLEGVWKGKGWIQLGEEKKFFNETEIAKIKVGGTLLQIDVFGTSVENESEVINNGLALTRFNIDTHKYEMDFYQADGSLVGASINILKDNIAEILLFRTESYTRFVIEIKNKQWFEKGFTSKDGKNWRQFFEMNLLLQ